MTLTNTALLERVTNPGLTMLDPEALATVIEQDTPLGANFENYMPLLITRIGTMNEGGVDDGAAAQYAHFVGTVRTVGGATITRRGWVIRRTDPDITGGHNVRVYGAPLNPEPIIGHFYRLLGGDGNQTYNGSIAEYMGPDNGGIVWRIVRNVRGVAPDYADGWQTWDWAAYVEVRNPDLDEVRVETAPSLDEEQPHVSATDLADLLELNVPVGIPTADEDERVHLIEDVPAGARQWVQPLADHPTQFELDPEPVTGEMYAAWYHNNAWVPSVMAYVLDHGFQRVGNLTSYGFETEAYHSTTERGEFHWARLIEGSVADHMTEDQRIEQITTLTNETQALEEKFEGMLDAIDQMKEDHDWCGEYEETMARGGMDRTKPPTRVAICFSVYVSFSVSDVPMSSSSVDEAVGEHFEVSVSDVSHVSFTGSTVIDITTTGEDEGDARESLTWDLVREELDASLSFSVDSITDWNVQSSAPDDDYDFD